MTYKKMNRAFVIAAGLLLPAWASADGTPPSAQSNATPQLQMAPKSAAGGKDNADKAGHELAGKGDEKKGDGKDVAGGSKAKSTDSADKVAERDVRRASQHKAERERLRTVMHGPMDDSLKQELRRHALRLARIDRIKSLATDASDKDTTARATKLLDKENARHDKWMTTYASSAPNSAKTDHVDPKATTPKAGAQ